MLLSVSLMWGLHSDLLSVSLMGGLHSDVAVSMNYDVGSVSEFDVGST